MSIICNQVMSSSRHGDIEKFIIVRVRRNDIPGIVNALENNIRRFDKCF